MRTLHSPWAELVKEKGEGAMLDLSVEVGSGEAEPDLRFRHLTGEKTQMRSKYR